MSLVSMREILEEAKREGYAVGYFESWDYGSTEAILKAAEDTNIPVIIGFGVRSFVTPSGWDDRKLACFAKMAGVMAEKSSVPVALMLNETSNLNILTRGMELGFNCVMFEGENLPLEKNISLTSQLVKLGKKLGVDVEAQVGRIPSEGEKIKGEFLTSPQEAEVFVRETGVVALAISVGNVHAFLDKEFSIDLKLLEQIESSVDIPLVMHGGTGFPDSLISEVISRGVHKFNVGTILKRIFLQELKLRLSRNDLVKIDPNNLIDSGTEEDVFKGAYSAIERLVKQKLKTYTML